MTNEERRAIRAAFPDDTPRAVGLEILAECKRQRTKPNPPGWAIYARPYAEAMSEVLDPDEDYFADSGKSVALYLLSNLSSWRGTRAKELKDRVKVIYRIK